MSTTTTETVTFDGFAGFGDFAVALVRDAAMSGTELPGYEAALAEALQRFLAAAQAIVDEHYRTKFPTLKVPTLTLDPGRRYVRVWREDGTSRSAHAFIDTRNGDILKPASWKKPATGARGNIFAAEPAKGTTAHGCVYFTR